VSSDCVYWFVPEVAATTTFSLPRGPASHGWKAVLHLLDVSYSFVGPLSGFGNSVLETYFLVSQGLIKGLELLGIPAEFLPAPLPSKEDPSAVLFICQGMKLV